MEDDLDRSQWRDDRPQQLSPLQSHSNPEMMLQPPAQVHGPRETMLWSPSHSWGDDGDLSQKGDPISARPPMPVPSSPLQELPPSGSFGQANSLPGTPHLLQTPRQPAVWNDPLGAGAQDEVNMAYPPFQSPWIESYTDNSPMQPSDSRFWQEDYGPAFAQTHWDEDERLKHAGTQWYHQAPDPVLSPYAGSDFSHGRHKPPVMYDSHHSMECLLGRHGDETHDHSFEERLDVPSEAKPPKPKPVGPKPVKLGELFRYATPLERLLNVIGLFAAAAAGAAQPLMTILFGNLTTKFLNLRNAAQEGASDGQLRQMYLDADSSVDMDVVWLVVIGIGSFVVIYTYMAIWVYTGEMITGRIRLNYLRAILRQEVSFFDNLGPGEITTRIQSDIQLIQNGISDKMPLNISFLSTFITGFVVAYARNWKLALVMTSILPCILLTAIVMNMFVSKYQQIELDHIGRAASIAEESLSTVRTIKAFGISSSLSKLYDAGNLTALESSRKRAFVSGVGIGLFFFCIYSAYALAFYFGSKLVGDGEIDSGIVMNVIFSVLIGAFSMAMLAPNLSTMSFAQAAGGKVYETIDRKPLIDSSSTEGLRPVVCYGHISVRGVNFAYPSRPDIPILHNFSLEIPPGHTTALVGPSGSGKSTIVSLVERFYDPKDGTVCLDGVPLAQLNIQWLRTQIGLVAQEPVLFATTVWENIAFGLLNTPYEHWSDEDKDKLIVEAAHKANAHDFIQQLPQGYHTAVGERAALLSGGQKQRVSIARAIVKNPRILLLDEATSALDTQSEGIVQEALDRAAKGRTTVTVAHRLSTIKNAHNIVVMRGGEIVEQGRHNDLLDIPDGLYANLVSSQQINRENAAAVMQAYVPPQLPAAAPPPPIEPFDEKQPAEPHSLERQPSHQSFVSAYSHTSHMMKLTGVAHGNFDPTKEKQRSLLYLVMRLARIGSDLLVPYFLPGVLCATLSGATYPAFSILFGLALDNYARCPPNINHRECPEPQRGQMRHTANHHALYFFIIAILSTISTVYQHSLIQQGSAVLMQRLRSLMFRAYLRSDVSFFDEPDNNSGTLTSSLAENSQKINAFVGVSMASIVQSISTLIVGAIIALIYGWKMSLVVIACIPFTLSAGFLRLMLVVRKDVKVRQAHLKSSQMACEAASSIRTVAALTREQDCIERYDESLQRASKVAKKSAIVGNFFYALSAGAGFWVVALGFWYGYQLMSRREYTSGQFFTIFTAVVFGSIQAGNVFNFVPDISNARGAGTSVFRLLDCTPLIDAESDGGIDLVHCLGHVRFENVHFTYPSRPGIEVLKGIDLDIPPGTHGALVGGSGSGKSTTIQLIERFYDVNGGCITIDGLDIRSLNLRSLRRHIALVSQEPTLYDGSIAFNLRLGALDNPDDVTDEQLREVAAAANILEFVEGLPNGFDTQVGGKGTQLSGGQKQRIAIARALVRNPKILLLDEATSALDSDSEKVVQSALDSAARGRTTISIAHRLATIARADRIFALQNGVVAEAGSHQDLMMKNGIYANLVTLQALERQE